MATKAAKGAQTVRCADCVHYPWVPTADPDLLPAHRCHPSLPMQMWTAATRDTERTCLHFEARKRQGQGGER